MTENYMSINNVWTPVVITNIPPTDGIIIDRDVRYNVTPLRDNIYIVHSKERLVLPDDAKQQISTLESANAELGKQVGQLTLANTALGKQVAALSVQIKGGK